MQLRVLAGCHCLLVLFTGPAGLQRACAPWHCGLPQQSLHTGLLGSHLVWQPEPGTAFPFGDAKLQPCSHTLQASQRGYATSSTSQRWHVCVHASRELRATRLYYILCSSACIVFCGLQPNVSQPLNKPLLQTMCYAKGKERTWGFISLGIRCSTV